MSTLPGGGGNGGNGVVIKIQLVGHVRDIRAADLAAA